MKLLLDTSVVVALLASDEEQDNFLDIISGYDYMCSESIVPEIELLDLNLTRALEISNSCNIYAYDAYVLECAERLRTGLVTLDNKMKEVGHQLGISIIEV